MISTLAALLLSVAPPAERRVAVVVGSNTAVAGRAQLQYAHRDAQAMAGVLTRAGHFQPGDVRVLLDPSPEAVLLALDEARAEARGAHTMLLFYFSGHADDHSLYPGGAALPLSALKQRLSDEAVGVRVGVIDSCRGGGWTQAKGLSVTQPFEVGLTALSSEGMALLASSSGLEDAHEAEALQGSFFTHHLVAGLSGAADQTGDGQVTLSEAFAYANRLTIRDSARRAPTPQHPSFDLRLRGRQDVVLTAVSHSPTLLTLAQKEGPLQVVQLSSGVVVVEAPAGEQVLRVTLPPGAYVVRRVSDEGVLSREVQVKEGAPSVVEEASLTLVGDARLASKGGPLVGRHQVALQGGVSPESFATNWTLQAAYAWRFSERFEWRAARALVSFPTATPLSEQLIRDFGVLPTTFQANRAMFGTDFVWVAVDSAWGRGGGLALSLSLGPTLVLRSNEVFLQPASSPPPSSAGAGVTPVAAGTASVSMSMHLPSVPSLSFDAAVAGHLLFRASGVLPQIHFGVGASWHFL
ncbi:MAG: caspase family protein [Myxococcales bacterium]|nr:caspase family protein [Myxococcales bacterium]